MEGKTSPIHSLVHIVMLIIIVALLSSYFQLQGRYEDLAHSCNAIQRAARDAVMRREHCSDAGSDNDCTQNQQASLATSPSHINAQVSSLLSVPNNGGSYSGTGITSVTTDSVSISESLFDSRGTPFRTTQGMTVDEFGKTQKGGSITEAISTEESTYFAQTPVIAEVEITEVQAPKIVSHSEDSHQKENNRIKSSTVRNFSVTPSSTEENLQQQNQAYDVYNQVHSSFESGSTSSSLDNHTTSSVSVKTLFDADTLIPSATTGTLVKSMKDLSVIDKGAFDSTQSDIGPQKSDDYVRDTIFSTDIMEKYEVSHDDKFCESEECKGIDDVEPDELNIQPMRLKDLFDQDSSSYEDNHDNGIGSTEDGKSLSVGYFFKRADAKELQRLEYQGTSSWCNIAKEDGSVSCHFQNLCYKTVEGDFMFLKGDGSVIDTQPLFGKSRVNAIPDINLSTVPDHNALMLSLIFIPAHSLQKFSSVAVLERKAFVMSRFKPDNIMHVLHDDILPLYYTLYRKHFLRDDLKSDIAILFADQFDGVEFGKIYSSLSSVHPVPLWKLSKTADVVCLNDVYVGLSNSTLWYQYGFFKPQGPLEVKSSDVMAHVRESANYLAKHLHSICVLCKTGKYLVLLSRKDNRLMLNEGELMMSVARATKLKIMSVSIETHSMEEIISIVRDSRGIIGMHGSLLIYVIFLQPGSIVIELFPYAVNPLKYTPFKTFCDLPESGIIYKSWTNPHRDRSISHPDWSPEMGGIHHLPSSVQEGIISQSEVPEHLCCEDPSWLYHIYQDTEVDIEAVTSLTVGALAKADGQLQKKQPLANQATENIPILPGPVQDLTCKRTVQGNKYKPKFEVTWKFPWNLEFITYDLLQTQLAIQDHDSNEAFNIELPPHVQTYSFEPSDSKPHGKINVWVRITVDHSLNGPYSFVACHLDR